MYGHDATHTSIKKKKEYRSVLDSIMIPLTPTWRHVIATSCYKFRMEDKISGSDYEYYETTSTL